MSGVPMLVSEAKPEQHKYVKPPLTLSYSTLQQQGTPMVVAALHPLPFCPPNFHGGWTIRMHRMIIAMSFSGRPRPGAGRAFIFGPVRPFAWPVRRHQTPRQEPLTHDSFRDRQEGVHVVFPGSSSVFLPHVVLCNWFL